MKIFRISLLIFLGIVVFSQCDNDEKSTLFYNGNEEVEKWESKPFLLYQNYPNPFNLVTDIEYELANERKIKIIVYSEDWEKVSTLVNGPSGIGHHIVQFNAADLPSGEYYYTLESGDYTQIRKMKVIK